MSQPQKYSELWSNLEPYARKMINTLLQQGGKSGKGGINDPYAIILYDADWQAIKKYSVTDAGLAGACAAAGSGDTIWLPASSISGDHTVPAGVSLRGIERSPCVLTGKIILSAGSSLNSLHINLSANDSNSIIGVQGPTSGTAYIDLCFINVSQTGGGSAYGILGAAGNLEIRNCYVVGNSEGGLGYGVLKAGGDIYAEGGWLRGSTAPVAGGSSGSVIASYSYGGLGRVLNVGVSGTPPADWTTLAFDDDAWSLAVLQTSDTWGLPIIGTQWITHTVGNRAENEEWLYRHEFILDMSHIDSATLIIRADNQVVKVYVNGSEAWAGYDYGSGNPGGDAQTVAINTALFDISGNNVIAIQIKNGIGPVNPTSLTYRLTLFGIVSSGVSRIVTSGIRMVEVAGEPAQGDRSAFDALGYPLLHTNDKDASPTALHHSLGTGANQAAAGNHGHSHTALTDIGTNTHAQIDTHLASTANPHTVTKAQVGLGSVANILDKLDATVAPTINDDSGAGYSVGSLWVDVTADQTYICVDATVGAAVWVGTSSTDAAAIHDNVAGEIAAITEKTTPADADVFLQEDSAASNAKKRVSWANIKATLKSYFDTLYAVAANVNGARVTHSAAQTLDTSGTLYALTFDSERWDDAGYHDTVTNNSRLTVAAAGWYLIGGECVFAANATGSREIGIRLNGGNFIGYQRVNAITSAGIATGLQVMALWYAAASDYVELWVRQYSGGSLNTVKSASHSPEFWIIRIK